MHTRTLPSAIKTILAVALVSTAAFTAPAVNAMPVTNTDTMTVQHTCEQTLGLTVNDTDYAACVSTLSRSLAMAMPAERRNMPTDRTACAQVGLLPGTNGYERCVANLDGALAETQLMSN
ncbi:MAG: hypothetical protein PW843_13595 [Azospirillaceae bacterium]|nr:hypothetical protein [Azospirillaceae bacterium]